MKTNDYSKKLIETAELSVGENGENLFSERATAFLHPRRRLFDSPLKKKKI